MIPCLFDYATPSALESYRDQALLGFSADRRRPVGFTGRIKDNAFLLRVALRAFGEALWSQENWSSTGPTFDPVVTVHRDRLLFEAFSQDQGCFVRLDLDPQSFEIEGEIRTGTTNLDFSAWLWAALAEIRTFRDTRLRIGSEGLELKTTGAGGRFERRLRLPHEWVRGLLQVQAAMTFPGTRFEARPVDLLAAIRYLRYTKAKVSPRALRYEFHPDRVPELVLEPWEHRIPFKGASHGYLEPRVIRLWGRRRLRLLEPLLPFTDRVGIYLKGRALPSFYVLHLPGLTFTLGLTGSSEAGWAGFSGASQPGAAMPGQTESLLQEAADLLRKEVVTKTDVLADRFRLSAGQIDLLMQGLCRQGKVAYDLERREYRYRELFSNPIEKREVFPPSLEAERARRLVDEGRVELLRTTIQETRKTRSFTTPEGKGTREVVYRDWHVVGRVDCTAPSPESRRSESAGMSGQARAGSGLHTTEIVVQDNVRIIFGTCTCDHFQQHLLSQGPCAEMLALLEVSEPQRGDLPVSTPGEIPAMRRPRSTQDSDDDADRKTNCESDDDPDDGGDEEQEE